MIQKVNMEKSWSGNNVGVGCSSALIGHSRFFVIKVGCDTVWVVFVVGFVTVVIGSQ